MDDHEKESYRTDGSSDSGINNAYPLIMLNLQNLLEYQYANPVLEATGGILNKANPYSYPQISRRISDSVKYPTARTIGEIAKELSVSLTSPTGKYITGCYFSTVINMGIEQCDQYINKVQTGEITFINDESKNRQMASNDLQKEHLQLYLSKIEVALIRLTVTVGELSELDLRYLTIIRRLAAPLNTDKPAGSEYYSRIQILKLLKEDKISEAYGSLFPSSN